MSQTAVQDGQETAPGSVVEQGKELVQDQARAARGTAGEKVGQQVETGAKQLGGQVLEVAHGFSRTSHGLRSEGKDQPAAVLEGITSRAETVGNYLTQTNSQSMLRDFEHFGRQRPWVAIAGGVALGFVASRFLKASSSRRFEDLRAQGYNSSGQRRVAPASAPQGSDSASPVRPQQPEAS
jgi:ElaB/YqjD/DUF883 family membrane-anchored ribosome-binding protein